MDNRGRTVTAAFGSYRSVRTGAIWQWDRGQLLQVSGITLPAAWEAHVANGGSSSDAEIYFGSGDTLAIDDKYLESGAPVVVWIYLHETEDDGETEYVVTIPVQRRKRPQDATPSESEESAIARAITALNAAVEATAADVQTAEQAKIDAVSAKDGAEAAKRDAVAAQGAAETAKRDAVAAQGAAETAKRDAVAAQGAAETAKGDAVAAAGTAAQSSTAAIQAEAAARAAQAAAGEAQDDAELAARQAAASETAAEASKDAAAQSAQAAAGSASSADGSARAAGAAAQAAAGSAQAAGASETAAGASALVAEGLTLGTQGGVPVGQDSTYYENNANYYSQLIASLIDSISKEETAQLILTLVHSIGASAAALVELESAVQYYDELPQNGKDKWIYITPKGIWRYSATDGYKQVSGGDLNGFSLEKGENNEVLLKYKNPEDETDTDELVLPKNTTGASILGELENITASLTTLAGSEV